jgi:hypothetical protein
MARFPVGKASFSGLEDAAQGSSTRTNDGKGIGHGRPGIPRVGRCFRRRRRWRLVAGEGRPGTYCVEDGVTGFDKKTAHHTEKPIRRFRYQRSRNTAAVSWTIRGASKKSAAAGRLLRVLALRQRVARASPLVVAHVAGDLNVIGDIPSRSFGYKKAWHCKSETEFLSLINSEFPLPQKRSWRGFRLSYALSTKVISELGMTVSPMGEWRRLRRIGKSFGGTGVPIADPSELTRTWRKQTSSPRHGWQQGSQGVCERAATAVENRYKLEQCVRHSEASTRRSPWTQVINPSTNLDLTTDTSSHFNTCSKDSRTKIPRV